MFSFHGWPTKTRESRGQTGSRTDLCCASTSKVFSLNTCQAERGEVLHLLNRMPASESQLSDRPDRALLWPTNTVWAQMSFKRSMKLRLSTLSCEFVHHELRIRRLLRGDGTDPSHKIHIFEQDVFVNVQIKSFPYAVGMWHTSVWKEKNVFDFYHVFMF